MLEAGGYNVDAAASAAEAVGKLDEGEYELVLSDLQMESPEAGLKVLAHARMMDYKPATALHHHLSERPSGSGPPSELHADQARKTFPELLGKVADLISERATRRLQRELRLAGV